jgi:enoyl-CoA hydratase/carnithine racemase
VTEPALLPALLDEYVKSIASGAPLTVRAAKRVIQELTKPDADIDLQLCHRLILDCFESEDYAEGRRAFMEKRRPLFKGR